MLVTLVAICARVPAQDYVTNNYVTNRLSLSGRVGLGISARFKGIAVLPVPALNRTTPGGDAYNYDDGYVLSDTSGNFGGQTWYWGYDNSASQISGNNILLSRNSSASIGSSEADDKPGYGAEVLYSRMLGAKGNLRYGFEAAINYLNFSVNDSRPRAASLTRVTDAYPFTPGTTPPAATPGNPYQGSFDGPGFVIGDTPVSSSTTVAPGAAVSNGHREFDADIWGIRVGPYLEFPLGEKFKLSVSGGLAAALISAEASWTESITISGTAGPSVHGSGRNTDFVLGGYLAGNAAWEINERWSIVGSVQYQYLGRYDHSFGGRAVEADLTHGIFITLGVGYKF